MPRLVQLGPAGEVQYNQAHPLPTSLWKSLALVDRRVPGTGAAVWQSVVERLFGARHRLAAAPMVGDGVVAATVGPTPSRSGNP